MKIFINALTIQPGGGLTVVKGLGLSLKKALPNVEIKFIVGNQKTFQEISNNENFKEDILYPFKDKKSSQLFILQNLYLNKKIKPNADDIFITLNHYISNIKCKQIVYHVNYRRFSDSYRGQSLSERIQEYLRDASSRKALKQADANIFESHFLLDSAKQYYAVNIKNPQVIYFGLSKDLGSQSNTPQLKAPRDIHKIVAITSPNPHKDNECLIRTLQTLREKEPTHNWTLDIVGGTSPDKWTSIKQYASERGVENAITWHGFCDQQQVTQILSHAVCLVSCSQLESFAMVAIEAMARSCPAVVADCAAMPESVGSAGILAKPGEESSFTNAILSISNSHEYREQLVQAGLQWSKQFHWTQCGESFSVLIGDLTHQVPNLH